MSCFDHALDLTNQGIELRRATNRGGDRPDTFLSLEAASKHVSAVNALVSAFEQLDIDANVLEDVPRVVAGMFSVAQRDRQLNLDWPGMFWDTESGKRLCTVVGLNPENKRHRQRIQQVRRALCKIRLHREVFASSSSGKKARVSWEGHLLQESGDTLKLEEFHADGLGKRHTFKAYRLAKPLWDMVCSSQEGGTPAFMALDERAFELDDSSSTPFNLYWTLVNRAYMSHYTRRTQPARQARAWR